MKHPKFPKCLYCQTNCYAIGFKDELLGGCSEQKEWRKQLAIKKAKEKGDGQNNDRT